MDTIRYALVKLSQLNCSKKKLCEKKIKQFYDYKIIFHSFVSTQVNNIVGDVRSLPRKNIVLSSDLSSKKVFNFFSILSKKATNKISSRA